MTMTHSQKPSAAKWCWAVDRDVTGIAKGAGMIRPNMATMLGFVATDAHIDPALVQPLCKHWQTSRSTA